MKPLCQHCKSNLKCKTNISSLSWCLKTGKFNPSPMVQAWTFNQNCWRELYFCIYVMFTFFLNINLSQRFPGTQVQNKAFGTRAPGELHQQELQPKASCPDILSPWEMLNDVCSLPVWVNCMTAWKYQIRMNLGRRRLFSCAWSVDE